MNDIQRRILVSGLAALYGLDWYKNRKLPRKVEEEDYNTKEPLAEQLAWMVSTINNDQYLL